MLETKAELRVIYWRRPIWL